MHPAYEGLVVIEPFAEKFSEFLIRHGLVVRIRKRPIAATNTASYFASIEWVAIKDGAFFISAHGNGGTPEEALDNYRDELAGKLIVIDHLHNRREVQCPAQWVPEAEEAGVEPPSKLSSVRSDLLEAFGLGPYMVSNPHREDGSVDVVNQVGEDVFIADDKADAEATVRLLNYLYDLSNEQGAT